MADPRLTPARADLAARHLEGKVRAARFVDGVTLEVAAAVAPVRRAPAPDAPLDTEALKGERVTVYDRDSEGWAWGQLEADGYVGWLPAAALKAPGAAPTHKVSALRTFAFPGPSIKLPPAESLPLGARIAVSAIEGGFAITAERHYLPAQHVVLLDVDEPDFVAVAERFVGTPYQWGGRESLGLDCSGLVQQALYAAGLACPRDSDQQAGLGQPLAVDALQRGDLIFWRGHVAMLTSPTHIVHANAFHMAVVIEPFAEAVARTISRGGGEPTGYRRI